jgi:hypothetical protein
MNLQKIKSIIDCDLPEDFKRSMVIAEIAKDEQVIPDILDVLNYERKERKKVITDLNLYLSKAHVALTTPKLNKEGFVQEEIISFFIKNKSVKGVGHCFMDLEKVHPSHNTEEHGK